MKNKTKIILALILAAAVIGVGIYLFRNIHPQEKFEHVLAWTKNQGWRAPIFFFLFYLLTAGIVLPVLGFTVAAGALFGTINGSLIILLSHTSAALMMFFIARSIGCAPLAKAIESNPKFNALHKAVADNGWKIIAMLRVTPIFNSTLINYSAGLTRISLRDYVGGTVLGILPGTLMYCYVGELSRNAVVSAHSEISLMQWIMLIFGLTVTVILTIYMIRLVKKTLKEI